MKRQVQQTGVRKWFGDDFISMQDEFFAVLEGFFGSYGQQFILAGCTVNGNDISAGIIGLIDGNGFHLCRFAGAQDVTWPLYIYPEKTIETRPYLDLEVKEVTETWEAKTSANDQGGYFQLKQDGTSVRFFDAIQTANRRFVTDDEKNTYAGQASAAIDAIRNGVADDKDTLLKLYDWVEQQLSGIDTTPDWNTIEGKPNFKALSVLDKAGYSEIADELKNRTVDNDGVWDFSSAGIIEAALSSNTTVSFTNLQQNKTLKVKLTLSSGATVTWPSYVTVLNGSEELADGTWYIYVDCWNTTPGSEEVLISITKAA